MESNWRWRVGEFGMWNSGVGLFARILTEHGLYLSDVDLTPVMKAVWLEPSAPGQLPVIVAGAAKTAPHFPYGNLVEPDN